MKRTHPQCKCGTMLLRASARVRKEGDLRPKNRISFTAVGWYCERCGSLMSGDWLVESAL